MDKEKKARQKQGVHRVLAHSYIIYLALFLIGVCFDFVFKVKILGDTVIMPLGFFFLIVASVLIIWAQKTGRDLRKIKEKKAEHFCRGPYCYTRIPTQWGLLFLMLGFAIIANAFFIILSALAAFCISRLFFLDKHDKLLIEKYGDAYSEYKRLVRF
ncbi:MAG TPA: hypothetical protein VGO63_02670 [Candidatus Paceibacterota bacterium]|jgi:protein-S-isoprenylcysteine O-methyltransferase Ste14|nr:hypothetical protein [Candidatus Paceibacterota bacterium]